MDTHEGRYREQVATCKPRVEDVQEAISVDTLISDFSSHEKT